MLNIIDEFSRECLAMVPQRRFRSDDVLAVLSDLFIEHGPPEHIRSDNVLCSDGIGLTGQEVSGREFDLARMS